ncbi:hypothetical protein GUJ93_ZPchr0011g27397 [Zizania palustris]|uniref:RIN4 pathogenic type III effector avirulence factor Avr cleavage site domain-containing protein n=1 Tax=Zizania palustris TaxID=103762 RepID=A0A8J5WHN9_ZIZPA|nr:hypothetical protein GUJ93_ZPchr0011g27397 [Zizania palustris]
MAGQGQGGHIPRFGDWKNSGGGSSSTPYTVFFEHARKRKNTPPAAAAAPAPESPLSRGNSGHGTPPHAAGAGSAPRKNKDPSVSRPRSQSSGGSVPAWGQWNESNAGGGQQYTLVFDQIRDERRSAPSTPTMEQLQLPTTRPKQINRRNRHKGFTCFGMCWK